MPHSSLFSLAVLATLLMFLSSSCATGSPDLGVRESALSLESVRKVVMVPPYTISNFGLSRDVVTAVQDQYVEAALSWFRANQFKVVGPREFEQDLTQKGVWQEWSDNMMMKHTLVDYFEPQGGGSPRLETLTLKQLASAKAFGKGEHLLFTEVVYFSQGVCQTRATAFSDVATEVDGSPGMRDELDAPCTVLNVQSKLVEPSEAQTVWYNKVLLEVRHRLQERQKWQSVVVTQSVEQLFGGERGLRALAR